MAVLAHDNVGFFIFTGGHEGYKTIIRFMTVRAMKKNSATHQYLHLVAVTGFCCALMACGSSAPSVENKSLQRPLNDTGTSFCRSLDGATADCAVAPVQDGNSGRDVEPVSKYGGGYAGFDFTKLDAKGKPLARQDIAWNNGEKTTAGEQWFCVKDNHTGLVWEIKSSAPESFNHRDHLYTWHNPDNANNGGFAGEAGSRQCGAISCDTASYVNAMNQQRWCGISTWRMPTTSELLSLVVTDHLALVAERHYFPDTRASHYWTSQSYAPDNTKAWYVYLSDGSMASTLKSQPMYIRLVANP